MTVTTKLTIKLFLIISLFVSAAFADDGHMPGGGFANGATGNIVCDDEGHMPGGGIACEEGHMPGGGKIAVANDPKSDDSILKFVKDYLYSLFG